MACEVKVIEDSISPHTGQRLTTLQLRYWRAIHAEFMTHRSFCLAGDSRLDFELPVGDRNGKRRVYSMTIKEFVDRWYSGSKEHTSSRHNGKYLTLPSRSYYTAREIAVELGFRNATNLNNACRIGKVRGAEKQAGQWVAPAESWEEYRNSGGTRSFSLKPRLTKMKIRQLNESTNEVQTSTVVNAQYSGKKPVYDIKTKNYKVGGSQDHLIYTQRGWVRIADIVVGVDSIATYKYGTGANLDPYKRIDGKWVSSWTNSIRDAVADRQHGKCFHSGADLGTNFHIHHVIPRHQRPDLAFDLDNVIAVTPDAHKELHGVQGWQVGVPLQSGFELVEAKEFRGEEDTYDLEIAGEYPNFFANGVVVHNSRNASSSRAIPINTFLKQVWNDPAGPIHWGINKPGMQANEELRGFKRWIAQKTWNFTGKMVCSVVWLANKVLKPHKQTFNRLLEPWQYISVVVTATEWDNFFELRNHRDAQPEIKELAIAMWKAMQDSKPVGRMHHLPYVADWERREYPIPVCYKLSTARCARVSYLTHDGNAPDPDKDIQLHDRLVAARPIHASPTEHCAEATIEVGFNKNFHCWKQYRVDVEQAVADGTIKHRYTNPYNLPH